MFRIGEFSKLTQVSIRMLRYYDEMGLLKAAEVDQWTGHRMYSVTQIPRLNKILYLRDSGFTVSEIALALEMADRSLLKTLEQKQSVYHDTAYKEQNVDIELCVPVSKPGKDIAPFCFRTIEPVPVMACTMVYGDFSNIKGGYVAFAAWLQKNSEYRMSSPVRQIVHRGAWNEKNPAKYLTEIQVPLEFQS